MRKICRIKRQKCSGIVGEIDKKSAYFHEVLKERIYGRKKVETICDENEQVPQWFVTHLKHF